MKHTDIDHLFGPSFDPDTIKILAAAYELAIASLHDRGQPEIVKEVLAKRIIEAAANGEHDPQRLCDFALGQR